MADMTSQPDGADQASDAGRASYEDLTALTRRIKASIGTLRRIDPSGDPHEQAEDFIANMDWRLPEDLATLGRKYRTIPTTLSSRMRQAFNGPSIFFHAYFMLGEHVIQKCAGDWQRRGRPRRKTDTLVRVAFRSLIVAREVSVLTEMGYVSGARARLRTLLELSATARLLERSPVSLSERYQVDVLMETWRQLKQGDLDGQISEQDVEAIERRAASAQRRFGSEITKPRGWTYPAFGRIATLSQIVRDFGPTSLVSTYTNLSHEVHSVQLISADSEAEGWIPIYGSGPRLDLFLYTANDCINYLHGAVSALLDCAYSSVANAEIVYWRHILHYVTKEAQLELLRAQGAVDPEWYRRAMLAASDSGGAFDFEAGADLIR